PRLECLEERTLLNNTAADGLLSAIQNNNAPGSSTTITLPPNTTYDFTQADNVGIGANALPVIQADITIVGSPGDIIERTGTTPFRLFEVAFHGSLTLENLTLQGGLAVGNGFGQGNSVSARGGAIYNTGGTLTLSNVTVKSNQAVGSNGSNPA